MFSQTILHKIFVTMKLEFLWKLQELIYFGFLAPDFDLWGGEGGGGREGVWPSVSAISFEIFQ